MAYPNPSSYVPLVIGTTDGPTLTALASASCIPVASRIQLPAGYWTIAKAWKGLVTGRVSCAATTPGTFRLDLRLGAAGSVVVFDSGPLNLNVIAKTSVPFRFEFDLSCRSVGNGTGTTLWGLGNFESEALVGSVLPAAGSNGSLLCPVGVPAIGAGFDNTVASFVDLFHTQTVGTGSLTVHQFLIWESI